MPLYGVFIGLTREELLEQRAIALSRISSGDRTSLSGAGKSSSKTYSMSATDMLREINYALGLLDGVGRGDRSRTYFDARVRR